MKKKQHILAAIAALVAGGVNAQTSVNIYGIADVGIEYLTNAAVVNGSTENLARLSSGNLSGSRLGFRGTEDLGGGLKAVFQLENGFDIDTGALGQNGRLFGRQAFVGLQSGFGGVTFGRQQNSLYDLIIKYDPFAFATRYSAASHDAILSGRADNAIKYTGGFGPVTATVFYSFGRNQDGEVAGSSRVSRNVGAGVAYDGGPFGVGLAVDQYHGNTVATAEDTSRRIALGASYTIGPVKGFAGYRHLKDELAAGGELKSNLYWLGASYQLNPALLLSGAYYHTARKDSEQDPSSIVLSASYAFSRRTDVYLTLAHARNKSGSNLGLNGFATNIAAGENQTGAIAGVRHRF